MTTETNTAIAKANAVLFAIAWAGSSTPASRWEAVRARDGWEVVESVRRLHDLYWQSPSGSPWWNEGR